ncbi:MAG: type I DNA topoisomerase [Muribaculaceae bacterium]|nr:type I DNA topoisomerase [Muribaculaceae bacterium]
MKNLVIVESPAKAKTIEKFLGKDYKVLSSYGHIRDLAKKGLDIKSDSTIDPIYEIPDEKKELVRKLKGEVKKADMIWLASDEDREGEAIAWHLFEVLGLKSENTRRIVFHEITKPAILGAIENPRSIDINRVNAQQARRVLDRIVGFELSPVLWRKIKPALSAGRVQSVAVRLICEREKEVLAFKPEPFFRVNAEMQKGDGTGAVFKTEFSRRLHTEKEAEELLRQCAGAEFEVKDVSVKPLKRTPLPPFTTSTLQQAAHQKLGYSVSQTMRLAQKLYEEGHITYMRTDSLNLSNLALGDIGRVIEKDFGKDFLKIRKYHTTSKGAQEAHEAIRPTYTDKRTVGLGEHEQRLYDLIWQRTVASQMADAEVEKTTVDIAVKGNKEAETGVDGVFRAEGEVIKFEGFLKVYSPTERSDKSTTLPELQAGERLKAEEITATERFTLPPARYTEATLVKKMEELGIGRPSTYAPTISTITARDYIEKGEKPGEKRSYMLLTLEGDKVKKKKLTENTGSEKGKLVPTDIGMIVNDYLTQHFPDILDYNFTAKVEEKFDEIAEGNLEWKDEISTFYGDFHPMIENSVAERTEHKVGERLLGTDPKSGKPVYVKIGRFGPIAQIGEATDDEKPRFASLGAGHSISTITLEEALKLFDLPRLVGEYEGKPVQASSGRFGPYVKFDNLFVSIPKGGPAPEVITLEESVDLIEKKRQKERESHIKAFPEMPGLEVLKGRFGPYLAYKPAGAKKATNYKIPKNMNPEALTFEEAKKLMEPK